MIDFEVIVVGAGPAGAMVTLELAKRKFRVLCLEREYEVGYPNKSTATTPVQTFDLFDIPKKLGFTGLSGCRIFGPSTSYTGEFDYDIFRLLQFRELKQYLIKEAIRLGAVTLLGTRGISAICVGDRVVGITYGGFEGKGKFTANVVIDATGPVSTLATQLGLWKKRPDELGVALEYFLENAQPDHASHGHFLDFYLGNHVAPGGYAWIFPTNDHQVKAGICKLNPPFKMPEEKTQQEYFHTLWRKNPQIKDAQAFEIHRCAHYITGGVWDCTRSGFIAIGDAVNKVNPIFGEGVRPALYTAKFAAEAIGLAREKNDYTKKTLSRFDQLWDKEWKTYIRFSQIFFQYIYATGDQQLDQVVSSLPKMRAETLLNLYLGNGTMADYKEFFRIIPHVVNNALVSSLLKTFTS